MQIAKRQGVVNPENTFFSVKRFIGRKMAEVKDESTQVPYRLVDSSGAVKIKSSNAKKDFSPEEISAQVLRKLVDDASKFLNDKVTALFCCAAWCGLVVRVQCEGSDCLCFFVIAVTADAVPHSLADISDSSVLQ